MGFRLKINILSIIYNNWSCLLIGLFFIYLYGRALEFDGRCGGEAHCFFLVCLIFSMVSARIGAVCGGCVLRGRTGENWFVFILASFDLSQVNVDGLSNKLFLFFLPSILPVKRGYHTFPTTNGIFYSSIAFAFSDSLHAIVVDGFSDRVVISLHFLPRGRFTRQSQTSLLLFLQTVYIYRVYIYYVGILGCYLSWVVRDNLTRFATLMHSFGGRNIYLLEQRVWCAVEYRK